MFIFLLAWSYIPHVTEKINRVSFLIFSLLDLLLTCLKRLKFEHTSSQKKFLSFTMRSGLGIGFFIEDEPESFFYGQSIFFRITPTLKYHEWWLILLGLVSWSHTYVRDSLEHVLLTNCGIPFFGILPRCCKIKLIILPVQWISSLKLLSLC